MRPLTLDRLDAMLREAIYAGAAAQIQRLGALMDTAEAEQKARRGLVTCCSAALWYAEQGLHVFALQPSSKIPHKGSRGCLEATNDPATIRGWWKANPDSNVAIATGHLVDVVDIDGTPGQVSRARNGDLFDSLTVLGTVSTPRPGGKHLYVPASGLGNKAGMLPGVDHRGKSGYVVAPPSTTDVGVYDWTRPLVLPEVAA